MVTMANAALRWLSKGEPDIGRARDAMNKVVAAGHQASDVIANVRGLFGKDTQDEKTPTADSISSWAGFHRPAQAQH